eukprot:ANDGO_02859.mRNA.1 hypothetical protein
MDGIDRVFRMVREGTALLCDLLKAERTRVEEACVRQREETAALEKECCERVAELQSQISKKRSEHVCLLNTRLAKTLRWDPSAFLLHGSSGVSLDGADSNCGQKAEEAQEIEEEVEIVGVEKGKKKRSDGAQIDLSSSQTTIGTIQDDEDTQSFPSGPVSLYNPPPPSSEAVVALRLSMGLGTQTDFSYSPSMFVEKQEPYDDQGNNNNNNDDDDDDDDRQPFAKNRRLAVESAKGTEDQEEEGEEMMQHTRGTTFLRKRTVDVDAGAERESLWTAKRQTAKSSSVSQAKITSFMSSDTVLSSPHTNGKPSPSTTPGSANEFFDTDENQCLVFLQASMHRS